MKEENIKLIYVHPVVIFEFFFFDTQSETPEEHAS